MPQSLWAPLQMLQRPLLTGGSLSFTALSKKPLAAMVGTTSDMEIKPLKGPRNHVREGREAEVSWNFFRCKGLTSTLL